MLPLHCDNERNNTNNNTNINVQLLSWEDYFHLLSYCMHYGGGILYGNITFSKWYSTGFTHSEKKTYDYDNAVKY